VKITIRCGALDGGKPHGNEVGQIERDGFPDLWFRGGNYDGLRWEERHHTCPKHGELQIHDEDVLRLALNPSPPVIMARSVLRMGEP
jgi:hypothetical protein